MTDERMAEIKAFIAQEVEAAVARAIEAAKAERARRAEPTAKDMEVINRLVQYIVREQPHKTWHADPLRQYSVTSVSLAPCVLKCTVTG